MELTNPALVEAARKLRKLALRGNGEALDTLIKIHCQLARWEVVEAVRQARQLAQVSG